MIDVVEGMYGSAISTLIRAAHNNAGIPTAKFRERVWQTANTRYLRSSEDGGAVCCRIGQAPVGRFLRRELGAVGLPNYAWVATTSADHEPFEQLNGRFLKCSSLLTGGKIPPGRRPGGGRHAVFG